MTTISRRSFVTALAAAAAPNFKMRDDGRYDDLDPREDARQVAMSVRRSVNQNISDFPDTVAAVIEQLVLRIRELEDRQR